MPQFSQICNSHPPMSMHAVELIPNHAIYIDICAMPMKNKNGAILYFALSLMKILKAEAIEYK